MKYSVSNKGSKTVAFKVFGGLETVRPGVSTVIDIAPPVDAAYAAKFAKLKVALTPWESPAEKAAKAEAAAKAKEAADIAAKAAVEAKAKAATAPAKPAAPTPAPAAQEVKK